MKKNVIILVVIFSVVLNIAFIGSYVYHRSYRYFSPDRQDQRCLFEQLDLSPGQREKFLSIRDRFHAFLNRQGQKIRSKQVELIDLLSHDHPNQTMIRAKQKEIQVLQQRRQARVVEHLLDESAIFTPEQRGKFFSLIRKRIANGHAPRPRWMPGRRVENTE